jgi:putative effector of murein hydrolase LrgA (UPF0299 family)
MNTILTIVMAVAISTVVRFFVTGWFESPMETTWRDIAAGSPLLEKQPKAI